METWGLQGLEVLRDGLVTLTLFLCAAGLLLGFGQAVPTRQTFIWLGWPLPMILALWAIPRTELTGPLIAWLLDWGLVLYNAVLLLTLMVDRFVLSVPTGQLAVQRVLNPKFSIGHDNPVQINVVNNSEQPISGRLQDDCPPGLHPRNVEMAFDLPPYGRIGLTYDVLPDQRGPYEFGKTLLHYRSRLGLLWIRTMAGRAETVQVYPDLRLIRKMRVRYARGMAAGSLQKRHLGLEGTQFSGLRNYYTGDDIRHISWTATSRLDTPVVRTFMHEVEQPIVILLDASRHMEARISRLSRFDHALNAALSFASVASDRGDQVGAGVFSNRLIQWIPVAGGPSQLHTLLDVLSSVQVESVEPDYEALMLHFARQLKRRSLVMVFTDLIDPVASRSLLKSLKSFSRNHLLMVVTLTDSTLLKQAAQYPETPGASYEKGVAIDLLALRRLALAELSRSRDTVVIDIPPEQLSEALINEYFAIKLKNRL